MGFPFRHAQNCPLRGYLVSNLDCGIRCLIRAFIMLLGLIMLRLEFLVRFTPPPNACLLVEGFLSLPSDLPIDTTLGFVRDCSNLMLLFAGKHRSDEVVGMSEFQYIDHD